MSRFIVLISVIFSTRLIFYGTEGVVACTYTHSLTHTPTCWENTCVGAVFNYQARAHTVTEVSQTNFDSCNGNSPLSNDNGGSTTIRLSSPGMHYFICTIPGHCSSGMKLAVNVNGDPSYSAASSPAAASAVAAAAAGALIKLALF